MNKRLFLLIFPILLLVSCLRETDWSGAPEIKATVETEPRTRTSLSVDESGVGTVYWSPADRIDVFFGTKRIGYTSQNSADATTAVFSTSEDVSFTDISSASIWGLYPSNSSSSCNGKTLTTELPSVQYGVPNTFDDDLFTAVAQSTSTTLQFYNVCGGIKFNLAFEDIKKITFCGNNHEDLAGTVSISFVNGEPIATVVKGVDEITLMPKTGSSFIKGADYYITLLPGVLSAGFTMTFTTAEDTVGTFHYTDAVTIKRSVFSKKGMMDAYASFGDVRQPGNVIYYTSSDGKIVTPYQTDVFGANIVSNEYIDGRGMITFDHAINKIGDYAFKNCSSLTSVNIPSGVTSIGYGAFEYCTGLIDITIPDGVQVINSFAFQSCQSITSISFPSSLYSIGQEAFRYCYHLESIFISNSLSYIGSSVFADCRSLTSIIVDSDNPIYDSRDDCNAIIHSATNRLIKGCNNSIIPSTVTRIGERAFEYCSGLTAITIPPSVEEIEKEAFYQCSKLSSVSIPVGTVSIGDGAFGGCGKVSSVSISESVSSIGENPFLACYSLVSINVASANSNFDSRDNCNAIIRTSTNELISGCETTIIPDGVLSIGKNAFCSCINLRSIIIPSSVTTIGDGAFQSCRVLTSISLPDSMTSIGDWAFNDCSSLVSIDLPSDLTSIGANVFAGSGLPSITIPSSVTSIGERAFASSSLTSITIPSSVTSIGNNAFFLCTKLDFVTINASVPPSGGEKMFYATNCPIYVPFESVETYKTTQYWSDYSDRILAIVDHPQLNNVIYYFSSDRQVVTPNDTDGFGARIVSNEYVDGQGIMTFNGNVTRIGYEAFAFSRLKSIIIPESVTSIDDYAFYSCNDLMFIMIPKNVVSIGTGSFSYCSSLSKFTVDPGNPSYDSRENCNAIIESSSNVLVQGCVNTIIPDTVTMIGKNAFAGIRVPSSITLPSSVTSIGASAFADSNLNYITIPSSVTSIGSSAFYYCKSLQSVIINSVEPPSGGDGMFDYTNNCPIYVPSGSVEAYKTAPYWRDYQDRIQAL